MNDLSLLDQTSQQAYVKKTFQFVILAAGSLLLSGLTYCISGRRLLAAGSHFVSKAHPLSLREKEFENECHAHTEC